MLKIYLKIKNYNVVCDKIVFKYFCFADNLHVIGKKEFCAREKYFELIANEILFSSKWKLIRIKDYNDIQSNMYVYIAHTEL